MYNESFANEVMRCYDSEFDVNDEKNGGGRARRVLSVFKRGLLKLLYF
jgi:hypothetical protein